MRKNQTFKFRDILQSNWLGLFKITKALKGRETLKNYPHFKQTKKKWQSKATCDSDLDSHRIKDIIVKMGEIVMGSLNYTFA